MSPMMKRVLSWLENHCDHDTRRIVCSADQIAQDIDALPGYVHEAFLHLRDDGAFRGKPNIDGIGSLQGTLW